MEEVLNRSYVISIIGRPNVGKSTIFNRLMKKSNRAITHDKPGVTRDRHYGITSFDEFFDEQKREAILVDTGGFYPQKIDDQNGNQAENNFNKFFNIMTEHAQMAIDESDLVLFVADVREGILPFDKVIADFIRTKKKKFWVLVNKFDSDKQWGEEAEFYSLGIHPDKMFMVSASHGRGFDDLRVRIQKEITQFNETTAASSLLQNGVTPKEDVVAKVALIGAPNAGKSTLLNNLVGASRALVSNIPGTTVDPINGFFDLYFGTDAIKLAEGKKSNTSNDMLMQNYHEFRKNNPEVYRDWVFTENEKSDLADAQDEAQDFAETIEPGDEEKKWVEQAEKIFTEEHTDEREADLQIRPEDSGGSFWRSIHMIDTAGIRRQKAIDDFIESQSVFRSLRCITESDIVLFMVDITLGIGHQDRRLIDISLEKGKSVIVCLNKFDLLKEKLPDQKAQKEWLLNLRAQIPWLQYCDLIPISAKYNKGLKALKRAMVKTILIRNTKLPTSSLNRCLEELVERHSIILKGARGKPLKVKYTSQIKSNPPTFLLFSNKSKEIPENYKRYLKNGLRREFNLDNTPIHLLFRTGTDLEKRMKKITD